MLEQLIEVANREYDGHFTIFKFTTNYRVCLGTLIQVNPMTTHLMAKGATLDEAIKKTIDEKIDCYKIEKMAL